MARRVPNRSIAKARAYARALIFIITVFAVEIYSQVPIFDAERAYLDLITQCSFGPRAPGLEGHKRCRFWLVEQLRAAGGEVLEQHFKMRHPLSGVQVKLTNIIARFDGAVGKPLMLCAHWDTRPIADYEAKLEDRVKPILGANDGASGVAVLLEISRLIGAQSPPLPILIVLFDGEDMGRIGQSEEYALGSRYWAAHQIPEPPAEAILLDMVGDVDLSFPMELFSRMEAPQLCQRLWTLAANLGLPAFVEQPGPAVEDDHLPLLRAGLPAVDIIDFDYPYWHTLADTPDKCAPESLEQVGRLLLHYIYDR
ncbi:MAG: M28 family peptidase [Calditrichaeota bacterium]|nr:M28 family peptidase [Calditrichota bacterium]